MSNLPSFWVASLARREDRRRAAELWMDQLPRVDFYDAIDGSSASETRLPQSDVERMRAMWTKDKTVSQRNRRRKAACFKTHRDMLKAHAEDGEGAMVVVEDDMKPCEDLHTFNWLQLPADGASYLAGRLDAARVKDMAEFKVKKEASRIVAAWRATEQRVQALPADRETGPYRISSSGALYIPSPEVARDIVASFDALDRTNHVDMIYYRCPCVTHLVFPALFVSDVGVGSITDIMASQTQLCGPEYNALEAPQKVRLSE